MMIFLYTMAEAFAEEAAPGFTLKEIWEHSGALARGVIVMLIVMLVASIFVSIERWLAFRSATNQSKALAQNIVPHLQKGEVDKAYAMAQSEEYKNAYLGALLKAGLAEMKERVDHFGLENAERAIEKAAGQELAKLKAWMSILATTGSTAPFVGLFGTTFGVINAFQGMATAGSGLCGHLRRYLRSAHNHRCGHRRGRARRVVLQLLQQPHRQGHRRARQLRGRLHGRGQQSSCRPSSPSRKRRSRSHGRQTRQRRWTRSPTSTSPP